MKPTVSVICLITVSRSVHRCTVLPVTELGSIYHAQHILFPKIIIRPQTDVMPSSVSATQGIQGKLMHAVGQFMFRPLFCLVLSMPERVGIHQVRRKAA